MHSRQVPRSEGLIAVHKPWGASATTASTRLTAAKTGILTCDSWQSTFPTLTTHWHICSWQTWVSVETTLGLKMDRHWLQQKLKKLKNHPTPLSYLVAHLISPLSNSLICQRIGAITATGLQCLLLPKAQREKWLQAPSSLVGNWENICVSNTKWPPSCQSHFEQ